MTNKDIQSALSHLIKDEEMKNLIEEYGNPDFGKYEFPYKSLIKYIIFQQLSLQSAGAIYKRFLSLSSENPKPNQVLEMEENQMKEIGLSNQKIKYIKELSIFFSKEKIDFETLSNDEIYNKLIKIKGIGPWTIDMFLIFTLYRTDILPIGDLGIKKGFKILYNLKKLPSDDYMYRKAKKWVPYRSVACIYLWRLVDGDTVF